MPVARAQAVPTVAQPRVVWTAVVVAATATDSNHRRSPPPPPQQQPATTMTPSPTASIDDNNNGGGGGDAGNEGVDCAPRRTEMAAARGEGCCERAGTMIVATGAAGRTIGGDQGDTSDCSSTRPRARRKGKARDGHRSGPLGRTPVHASASMVRRRIRRDNRGEAQARRWATQRSEPQYWTFIAATRSTMHRRWSEPRDGPAQSSRQRPARPFNQPKSSSRCRKSQCRRPHRTHLMAQRQALMKLRHLCRLHPIGAGPTGVP